MIVKICGITNSEDADAAVAAGASALGFIFYRKSPRYIAPHAAWEIAASVPRSVMKVGVFVNESPREIDRIAGSVGLDVAQLHGSEMPNRLPRAVRVWKAFRVGDGWTPAALDAFPAEAFLLDSLEHGQVFDWKLAVGLKHRVILAGGLGPDNIREAIGAVHPWGVDASSRLENEPGRKDHEKMRQFIAAALDCA
jgi:phosphoribosylanthranilate isomerase